MNIEVLWDGTYGLSSLSEKTRKSNRLQMSLQRQHFLLSYLKTLSVGPAGVRTHDLPHGSPVLNQLSQPVGNNQCVVYSRHLHQRIDELKYSAIVRHLEEHDLSETDLDGKQFSVLKKCRSKFDCLIFEMFVH